MEEGVRTMSVVAEKKPALANRKLTVFMFWLDEVCYAVPLSSVLAVTSRSDEITQVPLNDDALDGVVRYRGKVTPVVSFARLLGVPSGKEVKEDLIRELNVREQDHIDWLNSLEQSVRDGSHFTKARDPHQCAFGKWYDHFNTRDKDLGDILDRFDEPHQRIHSLADKLLGLRDRGQVEEALAVLDEERETTLSLMRRLFRQARAQLRVMIRPVLLYLTDDGSTPYCCLALDEINDVLSFDEDALQATRALDQRGRLEGVFRGMLTNEDGPDAVLLDMDGLRKRVTEGVVETEDS